jgi:preprotein translocase subunit SecE
MSDASMAGMWAAVMPAALERAIAPATVGRYIAPVLVLSLGAWLAFRIVNIPRFADFLISVEAEMNKVSWPSRGELYRASLVVIVVIFLLTAILLFFDVSLKFLLEMLDRFLTMIGG